MWTSSVVWSRKNVGSHISGKVVLFDGNQIVRRHLHLRDAVIPKSAKYSLQPALREGATAVSVQNRGVVRTKAVPGRCLSGRNLPCVLGWSEELEGLEIEASLAADSRCRHHSIKCEGLGSETSHRCEALLHQSTKSQKAEGRVADIFFGQAGVPESDGLAVRVS